MDDACSESRRVFPGMRPAAGRLTAGSGSTARAQTKTEQHSSIWSRDMGAIVSARLASEIRLGNVHARILAYGGIVADGVIGKL